jgi:hypothetical protein
MKSYGLGRRACEWRGWSSDEALASSGGVGSWSGRRGAPTTMTKNSPCRCPPGDGRLLPPPLCCHRCSPRRPSSHRFPCLFPLEVDGWPVVSRILIGKKSVSDDLASWWPCCCSGHVVSDAMRSVEIDTDAKLKVRSSLNSICLSIYKGLSRRIWEFKLVWRVWDDIASDDLTHTYLCGWLTLGRKHIFARDEMIDQISAEGELTLRLYSTS